MIVFLCYIAIKRMAFFYSPFRKEYAPRANSHSCPFCDPAVIAKGAIRDQKGKIMENESCVWVVNHYPKFEGHTMVVPKRHILTLDDESDKEVIDRQNLIKIASHTIRKAYPEGGVEIFLQFGEGSEASVRHLHWHVLPALPNDPLRSFEKLGQFYTPNENGEIVLKLSVKIQYARESLLELLAKTLDKDYLP